MMLQTALTLLITARFIFIISTIKKPNAIMKTKKSTLLLLYFALFSSLTVLANPKTQGLFESALKGDVNEIQRIVKSGFDINTKDKDGNNALFYAVEANNSEVIKSLVKHGININEKNNNGNTPLMIAGTLNKELALNTLLESGADTEIQHITGQTVLHIATLRGNINSVNALIAHGANVNVETNNGYTPLKYAALTGSFPITNLLLNNGAYDTKSELSLTALKIAELKKHDKVAELLKSRINPS